MASASLESPIRTELYEDEILYEVVDGKRVEKPTGPLAIYLGSQLGFLLADFAEPRQLGQVVNEMLFGLDPENRHQRRPSTAYVSYRRWPEDRRLPDSDPWEVIPNLAVETICPTTGLQELMQKVDEYFEAGVELVWVVHPDQAKVYVYQSPTDVRILTRQDELDGGKVLPNFRLKLSDLLPQPA